MSKKLKIFIVVFLIIAIPVGVLAVWQRENINSFIYSMKYSDDDLSKMLDKNKEELNSAVSGVKGTTPRELKDDEIAALGKGEISEDDAVEISLGLTTLHEKIEQIKENAAQGNAENTSAAQENNTAGNTNADTKTDNSAGSSNKGGTASTANGAAGTNNGGNQPSKGNGSSTAANGTNAANGSNSSNGSNGTNGSNSSGTSEDRLANESTSSVLIAKLYVLKGSYVAKLDALESEGIAEYANTPNKNTSWKASMISKYSGKVAALEGECDAKFEAIVSELKTELEKNGEDTSIIKTIRSTYEKEKQIKKANYLNTYMD